MIIKQRETENNDRVNFEELSKKRIQIVTKKIHSPKRENEEIQLQQKVNTLSY